MTNDTSIGALSRQMRRCGRRRELVAHGLAPASSLAALEQVASRYAVAITPDVAALIDPNDPHDPIARQYVPAAEELDALPIERADPIGDHAHSPVAGIVHRYPDRVLFKLVHVCAVYCRFCFRREMVGPGKDTALSDEAYANALAYIRAHREIWEVILTGGDPLMLSARRLRAIMRDLASIRAREDHSHSHPYSRRRSVARHRRACRCVEGQAARPRGSRCMPIIRAN